MRVPDAASPLGDGKSMSFQPRLIRTARDAELAACEWLRSIGFEDAAATPVGPDAGVDIVGSTIVAQVKAEVVPTGRPVVQAIKGVAAHYQKQPVLFTLAGTTVQAARFADEAGVAVFRFDLQGVPVAQNAPARSLQRSSATSNHDVESHETEQTREVSVDLGPVGRLLVGVVSEGRSLVIHGFAIDADPVSASLADHERCNELGQTWAERFLEDADTALSSEESDRWLHLSFMHTGALTLWVNWTDEGHPFVVDGVVPSNTSDSTFLGPWDDEPAAMGDLTGHGVADSDDASDTEWTGPHAVVLSGHSFIGAQSPEHLELVRRLQLLQEREDLDPMHMACDLDDEDGPRRAVELLEYRLQRVGTTIERLHWWAFDCNIDPNQPGVRLVGTYDAAFIATETWVTAQRVWPPSEFEDDELEPPAVMDSTPSRTDDLSVTDTTGRSASTVDSAFRHEESGRFDIIMQRPGRSIDQTLTVVNKLRERLGLPKLKRRNALSFLRPGAKIVTVRGRSAADKARIDLASTGASVRISRTQGHIPRASHRRRPGTNPTDQ